MAPLPTQQHKIMRQVLEVRGCPREAAQRIQSELRGTFYQRLLPVIDRICTDLGKPGRVDRIDKLEIDLGELPLDALDASMTGQFETAFGRELAAAIGDAPKIDSGLELFGYFVETGTVPWWANRADRDLLETNLDGLIKRSPQAVHRTIRAAQDPERMLRRIALAYSDGLLDALAGSLAPALAGAGSGSAAQWVTLLERASKARGNTGRDARNLWWEEVLRAAGAGGAAVSDLQGLFRATLTRVARRLGWDYRSLLAELRSVLDDSALLVPPRVRDIIKGLSRELGGGPKRAGKPATIAQSASAAESARADLMKVLAQIERGFALDTGILARLRAVIKQLPVHLQAHAIARLEATVFEPTEFEAARARASGGDTMSRAARDALATLARDILERLEPAPDAPEDTRVVSDFTDADELYVENAGLVILWPFLESFFNRLGFIEEKKFKDEAAAQRAVGLLQYIAGADAAPPEFLLPVNKALCGIAQEQVFDFGPEITAQEIEECNDLLVAVIQQAPILREMSIAGFRASFLLRKGQLSARDGNWLLRVERETHDIVLDRFPWGLGIVKLPWMQAMIQVEW